MEKLMTIMLGFSLILQSISGFAEHPFKGSWQAVLSTGDTVNIHFKKNDHCRFDWKSPLILTEKASFELDQTKDPAWLDFRFLFPEGEIPLNGKTLLTSSCDLIQADHFRLYLTGLVKSAAQRPIAFSRNQLKEDEILDFYRIDH